MIDQHLADELFLLEKICETKEKIDFPFHNEEICIPLISVDKKHQFKLDVSRKGQIELKKTTYQTRTQTIIRLRRLDVYGNDHKNPQVYPDDIPKIIPLRYNGQRIPCPHIHIYTEQFHDRWAIPALDENFTKTSDLVEIFKEFLQYCNIIEFPVIQKVLM